MPRDPRYALYFVPPGNTLLGRHGAAWLGRDAWTGRPVPQPVFRDLNPGAFHRLTARPRRFGFHATLKAPFRLKAGRTADALAAAVRDYCDARERLSGPALHVARLGDFLALRTVEKWAGIDDLAADVVRRFDGFRAPLAEPDRRGRGAMDDREADLFERWGYPYVMDRYRFHLTLTDSASAETLERIAPLADAHFAPLRARPTVVDGIALLRQISRGGWFHVIGWFPFGAPASRGTEA